MTHRSATLHRLVALPLAVLVGMEAAATGQAEDLQPGSPVWQQFILEHTDEARRLREAGEYGRAVSFLTRAAEEAQRARPETSTSNDRWYLNLAASEAQQLVAALAQALDRALDQLQSDSLTWRAAWLADPSVDRALQQARALRQSVPERADELVGDLRVAIRAYLGALYGEPIRPYRSARAQSELASSIDAVVREVEEACRSSSPTAARISLTRGLRLAESMEIVDARRAASEWNRLVTTTGEDVELAGLRPSELRQLVEACEQQLALWEEGFATLDGGGAQRLQEAVRAAQGVVLDHARVLGTIEELERSYRSARETWRGLDPEAATATPPPTWTDRALDEAAEVREETIRLEQLLRETADDGSVRTVLLDIKAWIEFIRGPEMLGRIDPFIADANEAAADIQRQLRRLDDEIERGRRCLADGVGDPANPSAQVSGPGPPVSVDELQATPTPTTASPSVPPPAPAPTATPSAPTQPVDPDVAGGLKITGPARIGVGWGVSLSATDHGGRPVSEVSWHAMADNIRVEGDGTVVGLRPGRATVMATAHGMRAFFDFNVVADDGAPGTPGGPPALATPMPDVVVVPPSQPAPTPTPASLPPSDGRTTDWAEPTPTPWFVPQESDPGTGEAGAEPADDGAGGGFEDLGTEVVRGSGTSAPPSRDGGAPSIPIGPAGAAVAGVDNFRLPPDTPTSDGGFEDLGTEIGRPDAEAQPDRADPPAREAQSAGAVVLPPTGPQQPEVAGEAGGSTETEAAATAADDGSAGSSEPTEGLTFLGETAGSAAAPSVDGPLVLLPPPGEGSPGPEGGPPSPGSPPGGPAPPPPGDGGGPFIPSRASVNGAGQPAAYHIFATCSRLGWAGALATYSVGPADAAIADHLLIAGEHAMWANRTSYPPLPAWPDWQARRGLWGDWAAQLARTRGAVFRGQIAHSLSTAHETLSQDLDIQMVGGAISRTPTCDAEYCRLGFLMAWGQQALAISEEARGRGDGRLADAASGDGLHRLRLARGRLAGYPQIIPASGRCADLAAVGAPLEAAVGGGGSRAARAAWEAALAAVTALAPGRPTPDDGNLPGGWVLVDGRLVTVTRQGESLVGMADNRELFRVRPRGGGRYDGQGMVTTRSGASEQTRWYDGLTITVDGDTARASLGQFGFTMTRAGESPIDSSRQSAASGPASTAPQCPVVHFNGEIEGDWAWAECCPLRFSFSGSEWIGAFTRLNDDMMEIGHRVGQPFMRLRSTGPLTYEGTTYTHWSSSPVIPVETTVIVAGSSMIKKETRLTMDGLVRRSHSDTSGRLHYSGFWVGCAWTPPDTLDCSVESDPHPDVKMSNASGADRLRQEGYSIIVFGPATGYEAISWIFEHNERPLCLDSIHPAPAHSQARPDIVLESPRMMGVEPRP